MMLSRDYIRPASLGEAMELSAQYGGDGLYLAGGTDVLVSGRSGKYEDKYIIDISNLAELKGIREENGKIVIGALTTHSQLEQSALIMGFAPLLSQSAGSVGSPQIRNHGTIGGNVANASPAADTLPALAALAAEVVLVSREGRRVLSLSNFILGAYKTAIQPGELIQEFTFVKPDPAARSSFVKLGRRNSLAISRLSCAGIAVQNELGRVSHLVIAPGSVFPVPAVLSEPASILMNKIPTPQLIHDTAKAVGEKMTAITGRRWSTEYKQPACAAICEQVLTAILSCEEGDI